MRGHEPLLAMRRRGIRPATVDLHIGTRRPIDWHQWAESLPHADVVVAPDEAPERLDLRFVVGMPVTVTGEEPERVKRLVLAAEAAGAASVLGFAFRDLPHGKAQHLGCFCTTVEDQSWRA